MGSVFNLRSKDNDENEVLIENDEWISKHKASIDTYSVYLQVLNEVCAKGEKLKDENLMKFISSQYFQSVYQKLCNIITKGQLDFCEFLLVEQQCHGLLSYMISHGWLQKYSETWKEITSSNISNESLS